MMRFFRIRTRFGTNWGKWGGGGGTERGEEERGEEGGRKESRYASIIFEAFLVKSTGSYFLTLLKCCSESGLTRHISVTRHTPVSRTPWFFSFKSWRVVGTKTSIRSGTLRTIRTAHSAAWGGGGGGGGEEKREGGEEGGGGRRGGRGGGRRGGGEGEKEGEMGEECGGGGGRRREKEVERTREKGEGGGRRGE